VHRGAAIARAIGLLAGFTADAVTGDPRRWHPVAGFGHLASRVEQLSWADSRLSGLLHTSGLVGAVLIAGMAAERPGRSPLRLAVTTGVATWVVLGGRSLVAEGTALVQELADGDLDAARLRLPSLCGRDPAGLDAEGIARAGLESVAENTSDGVVAPLFWGAVAGVPGLLGYRAVNTLDAMIGHRSPRYLRFGWAAARLDDVLNVLPARLTAALMAATAPAVGGSCAQAVRTWSRDARLHPSPNAGPVEAAAAGALGVRVGGTTSYVYGTQERPWLGNGRPPAVSDLGRMIRLSRLVGIVAAALAGAAAAVSTTGPGGPTR
jgi:adenosylcobinamide-phosphate synthase